MLVLQQPSLSHLHDSARVALLEGIKADQMAPYYSLVVAANVLPLDQALLDGLEKENTADDIADALRAKAGYLTRIGEKVRRLLISNQLICKPPITAGKGGRSPGKPLSERPPGGFPNDIVLTLVRIGIFFGDNQLSLPPLPRQTNSSRRAVMDRRNSLQGLPWPPPCSPSASSSPQAHFSSTLSRPSPRPSLLSYNDFVSLTSFWRAHVEPRRSQKKIIGAPEVHECPARAANSRGHDQDPLRLHYDKFFVALATLEQTHLLPSRLLAPHASLLCPRDAHSAYAQLLQSYSSLTLESLAHAELSRFIASGRLHATIDRCTWKRTTDTVIRKGDVLLNSIQRLSKVLY
ncbi:PCI-domain-containing protein [Lactarius hengduanensis]|nr:PCI-domain-containing protein [Lactarius hengduanensis]